MVEIFSKETLIRDKNLFLFAGRITASTGRSGPAIILFIRSMNSLDLLKILRRGQIIEYEVTVVEGDSLREIAEKLAEKGIASGREFHETFFREGFPVFI